MTVFSPYRLFLTIVIAGLATASLFQTDQKIAASLLVSAFTVTVLGLGYSLAQRTAYLSSLQSQLNGVHEQNRIANERFAALESTGASLQSLVSGLQEQNRIINERLAAFQSEAATLHPQVPGLHENDRVSDERFGSTDTVAGQSAHGITAPLVDKLDKIHCLIEFTIDSIDAQRQDISDLRKRLMEQQAASSPAVDELTRLDDVSKKADVGS